jgi:hypothetical protein
MMGEAVTASTSAATRREAFERIDSA